MNRLAAELLHRSAGVPLAPLLRCELERRFQTDLSSVRIHTGEAAAEITRSAGALALTHGDNLFFSPEQFTPDTRAGKWLLAHELAHVIQQRGGIPALDARIEAASALRLENEASIAANQVLSGATASIAPSPDCPAILPAVPLAIWAAMAAAAAIGIWSSTREEDIKEDSAEKDKHLYETGWGFIPFVGSVDQVFNGRTVAERLIGTAFLVMDVSLAGGIVKGVAMALRAAGRLAIAELAKGGGTAAAREGYQTLIRHGAVFGTKERVAQEIVELSHKGPLAVVGAEGKFNHSATFLIRNGRSWKLHGGPLKFLFQGLPRKAGARITHEQALRIAQELNSVTLYRLEENVARDAVQWWARETSHKWWELAWRGEGCAGTQAVLLDVLGHGIPGSGGFRRYAPLLPIFLDGARMAGPGVHRIINPGRMIAGSAAQLGVAVGVRDLAWGPNWLYNVIERDLALYELGLQAEAEQNVARGLQMQRVPEGAFSSELWSGLPPERVTGPLELAVPDEMKEQLVEDLRKSAGKNGKPATQPTPTPPLDAGEMRVYNALTTLPKGFDQLARQLGLTPRQVTVALESLVRKGLARWVQVNSDMFGYARAR
jgi:hypothetical protein